MESARLISRMRQRLKAVSLGIDKDVAGLGCDSFDVEDLGVNSTSLGWDATEFQHGERSISQSFRHQAEVGASATLCHRAGL